MSGEEDDVVEGIKLLSIRARTTFHTVSAYEFEYLKTEEVVRERLSPCTLYLIVQRPLTYFTNVRIADGEISFEIVDNTNRRPLRCSWSPTDTSSDRGWRFVNIEVQFYTDSPGSRQPAAGSRQPYDHVAGFKVFDEENKFLYWFGPQKFLHEYARGALKATVSGDVLDYLDFEVHYIGKSFSQKVWNRLTGHHKMQKILTMEDLQSSVARRLAYEVSLIMLDIVGVDEVPILGPHDFVQLSDVETPIRHKVRTEEEALAFFRPAIDLAAAQLTNEVEAKLINLFKPKYNEVLYESYPNIGNGTRSLGYTKSDLIIEQLLATLRTDTYTINATGGVFLRMSYSGRLNSALAWDVRSAVRLAGTQHPRAGTRANASQP